MSTITRTHVSDLRGAARLAFDATLGITTLVEKMNHTIPLVHPPLGASRAAATGGLTGLIYRGIRGTTRVIGKGIDAGLTPVAAFLPEGETAATRDAWVSAINGVYGDHLERTFNPLAIDMQFRHDGQPVDPELPADVVTDVTGKVMVVIHGLCLNEQHWNREGRNRIEPVGQPSAPGEIAHRRFGAWGGAQGQRRRPGQIARRGIEIGRKSREVPERFAPAVPAARFDQLREGRCDLRIGPQKRCQRPGNLAPARLPFPQSLDFVRPPLQTHLRDQRLFGGIGGAGDLDIGGIKWPELFARSRGGRHGGGETIGVGFFDQCGAGCNGHCSSETDKGRSSVKTISVFTPDVRRHAPASR